MKKFEFALLASVATLSPLPAMAQSDQADAPAQPSTISKSTTEESAQAMAIVVTGILGEIRESGRAVTLIRRNDIEDNQTVVLSDLLATTPGVTVSRNGGVGGFTGVRIRGAEAEQTLVLIDGVRVNDPSSPGGGFDFGNLLAGSIDHVEVLRGPNSVVWGSQVIGGVVNIVTADRFYGIEERGNLEYGDAGTVSANAALIGGSDSVTGSLTGGYYRTDGISAAANGSEPDGYRQYGATGRLRADVAKGVGIDLRGYFADSRAELDGFPPPTYALADDGEYSTARELFGYAGVHADLLEGMWRNRAGFSIADIHRDNFDPSAGTAATFFGRGRSERYEYQTDFRAIDGVVLVAGAEHEDSRFNDGSTFASTGVTSAYGEAIVTPAWWLTVNGGARYDRHRSYGGHGSFGISAALRPANETVLRASYGDGFKAPTLYQLFSFYGDRGLRPETARSYEVGIDQGLIGGRVKFAATWFHRDTRHQIDFDLGTFKYGNIDRARAEGIEAEVTANPFMGLSLRASYTHVTATNLSPGPNSGNDLARRPRDSGSVSIDYVPNKGPSFGATLLRVGPSFDDAGNFTRLHGYTLASIRAEMPFGNRFAIYGRIENLFDAHYQTVAGYGTQGRAAYAGVRVKFD